MRNKITGQPIYTWHGNYMGSYESRTPLTEVPGSKGQFNVANLTDASKSPFSITTASLIIAGVYIVKKLL